MEGGRERERERESEREKERERESEVERESSREGDKVGAMRTVWISYCELAVAVKMRRAYPIIKL